MGEASGEIIAPPQTQETKEADANFGLSVNGSQIIALANLNYLEKYGFPHPAKPNLLDRLKILKNRPARQSRQRLTAIKELVLQGKTQEAKTLLQQGLNLPNPVHKSEDSIKQTIDVLSRNVPAYEALRDKYGDFVDLSLHEFIQSLPGKSLKYLPKKSVRIFLTQLGSIGSVDLELKKLNLYTIALGPPWGMIFTIRSTVFAYYRRRKSIWNRWQRNGFSQIASICRICQKVSESVYTQGRNI